jgi:hypothetical protein
MAVAAHAEEASIEAAFLATQSTKIAAKAAAEAMAMSSLAVSYMSDARDRISAIEGQAGEKE